MWTSAKPGTKWRCPGCQGRGCHHETTVLIESFQNGPLRQVTVLPCTCVHCDGKGWTFKRPFWFWNRVEFRLPHERTEPRYREFLHPERDALERQLEQAGAGIGTA
ncbi:MAG TPA: hypothetical protein VIF43_00465 [Patescibacteria group bacterium]|jgi:hypothetical protein